MVGFFFFDSKLFALVPKTCHLLLLDLKFFVWKLSRNFNTLEKAIFSRKKMKISLANCFLVKVLGGFEPPISCLIERLFNRSPTRSVAFRFF